MPGPLSERLDPGPAAPPAEDLRGIWCEDREGVRVFRLGSPDGLIGGRPVYYVDVGTGEDDPEMDGALRAIGLELVEARGETDVIGLKFTRQVWARAREGA